MIAAIRIYGSAGGKKDILETLSRLRMRRKLACVLISEDDAVRMGMLNRVRDYTAFGKIDEKMLEELVEKRGAYAGGKKVSKKDVAKIVEEIKKGEYKIKPFFRLHPPVGGFKRSTKVAAPKGVLGKHEDISKLLRRML